MRRAGTVLVALLAACSAPQPPPPPPPRAVVVVTPGTVDPWAGAAPAIASRLEGLGLEPGIRRPVSAADVEPLLVRLGEAGTRLVVCLGPVCETAVFTVAPGEPTTRWIVAPGSVHAGNAAGIEFAWEEAAYVAGALAAAAVERPAVRVTDPGACGEAVVAALRGGLRSRARRFELLAGPPTRGAPPADVEVACPGVPAPRAPLVVGLAGARPAGAVAVAVADAAAAVERVARDLVVASLPGRAYRFDLASALLRLEITPAGRRILAPEALAAADEATGEVISGVAEIEILGF